jgi:hypothetical protein
MAGNVSTDGTNIYLDDELVTFPAGDNRPLDVKAGAVYDTYTSLLARANTALTNNATYIALASPSTAQNTAQVKALTRQTDALIRFLLRRFDSSADA